MLSDAAVTLGLIVVVALMLGLINLPSIPSNDGMSPQERLNAEKRKMLEAQGHQASRRRKRSWSQLS
jgi:hypothetical protein